MTGDLFDRISELKEKFKNLFKHKKKLRALENYAQVNDFHHKDYLILIKKCLSCGFLGNEEARFLSHMVDTYFMNHSYLDWTHKTPWLKAEMQRLERAYYEKRPKQMEINFFKNVPRVHVPIEALTKAQRFFREKRI